MNRILPLTILLSLLLIGCSSNKQCCKWTSQSNINNISFDDIQFVSLLSSDTVQVNYLDPLSLLSIEDFGVFRGEEPNSLSMDILNKAFEYEGVRYRTGGLSEKGFDCSGLVYKCYSIFGIPLPRTSIDMSNAVYEIPKHEAKEGDLIFFRTNRRHKRINHVGIVIGADGDGLKFIHASIKKGVIVSSTAEGYYSRTYAKVGRIKNSSL